MTVASTIYRTNPLPVVPNVGKDAALRVVLAAWRDAAEAVVEAIVPALRGARQLIGGQRRQMVRHQVVGRLQSLLANRQNDFRHLGDRSSLDATTKHQLDSINKRHAWFNRATLSVPDGSMILEPIRGLARRIMRYFLSKHCRPSFKRCNMVMDQRRALLLGATNATTFDYGLRLGTLDRRKTYEPLKSYPYHDDRPGDRCNTVQIKTDRDGRLFVGIVTAVTDPFEQSRAEYQPLLDAWAIDVGQSTPVATDAGDLMGRSLVDRLAKIDKRIDKIARTRQRAGPTPQSKSYDRHVRRLRGCVETEINRVLERLVRLKRPAQLILGWLDLTHPDLSRRMKRLVRRGGRAVFRKKRQDLEERFGIETSEVNAAYTSQQCSSYAFTCRGNRPARASCRCGRYGKREHTDLGAVRSSRTRCSEDRLRDSGRPRRHVLAALQRRRLPPRARRSDGRGGRARRSAQRGWSGEPLGAGAHWPGPSGSALPDPATAF